MINYKNKADCTFKENQRFIFKVLCELCFLVLLPAFHARVVTRFNPQPALPQQQLPRYANIYWTEEYENAKDQAKNKTKQVCYWLKGAEYAALLPTSD